MNFKTLNVKKEIVEAIDTCGYETLTPIQEKAIPVLLEGEDVIGQAPTGTGKTLAYAIPMLNNINVDLEKIQAIVLCPTRELVIQSVAEIKSLLINMPEISAVSIYGGQAISRQLLILRTHPQIVVGTPGRLLDHIERGSINLSNVNFLVLDECDEMLNMGFRKPVNQIIEHIPGKHQTTLFSATVSAEIKDISHKYQKKNAIFLRTDQQENEDKLIKQYYIWSNESEKTDQLCTLLDTISYNRVFIFCRTKRNVDKLSKSLISQGYSAVFIHGNRSQHERDTAMQAFRNNTAKILIATDIAARGIDIDDVDYVVNYNLPDEDEYYVHRIGRTGRANKEGRSYTFLSKSQKKMIKTYESLTKSKMFEFTLMNREERIIMESKKAIAEAIKLLEDEDISTYENILEEYMTNREEQITTLQLAAVLLKKNIMKPTSKVGEEKKETKRICRGEDKPKEKVLFTKSTSETQRFFINIGANEGLDEKTLIQFICDHSDLQVSDFSDAYIKDTFSFFEVPASKIDEVMSKIADITYCDREVRVEPSEKRDRSHSPSYGDRDRGHYGKASASRGRHLPSSTRVKERHADSHSTSSRQSSYGTSGRNSYGRRDVNKSVYSQDRDRNRGSSSYGRSNDRTNSSRSRKVRTGNHY